MDRDLLRRFRPYPGLLVTLGVLLAGGYAAFSLLDVGDILAHLRDADRRLLALAAIVATVGWPLRGWRYRDILAAMRTNVGVGFLTLTVTMSQTANLVVPARAGDGVRAVMLADRRGVALSTGIASVLVERVLDVLAVLLLGGGALVWLGVYGVDTGGWLGRAGVLLVVAIATAGLVLVAARRISWRHPSRWVAWVPDAVRRGIARTGEAMALVGRQPQVLGRLTLASIVVWAVDVLVAGLVAIAVIGSGQTFAGGLGVGAITLAVAGGNLAKSVPLTQGGIGLYESAAAGLLVLGLSLSPEAALTIAVLDHGLKNGVTILAGIVGAIWLHLDPLENETVTNH